MNVSLGHTVRTTQILLSRLAAGLRGDGFQPRLCEIESAPGANQAEKIENGMRQADLALLIWSPNAAATAATHQRVDVCVDASDH